ncbi:protein phosphatase 1 regulatory subunit 37-like isoform X2 [Cylas formicarius]|uniref:protein phosphatase 1 regulatory subunit 37-like isoform X2 n=1 Tax=Cylas formicarius TaxID=197179 RepID=UPI002958A516|nr:protein phosphatase 1 regulatory subunit 37-like isoform X2 [Cylas formicarius]
MDLGPCKDDYDTPILIDSGTESISESPLTEDPEHSKESTQSNMKNDTFNSKASLAASLIDKSFSIDEEELCTPLEPTPVGVFPLSPSVSPSISTNSETTSEEDDGIEDITHIEDVRNELEPCNEKEVILMEKPFDKVLKRQESPIEDVEVIEDENDDPDRSPLITVLGATNIEAGEKYSFNSFDGSDDSVLLDTPRTSILRKSSYFDSSIEGDVSPSQRRVFFPMDQSQLVTYKEPEKCHPWVISQFLPSENILQTYQNSCKKHKTIEIDAIKSQIQEIKNNTNHSAILKLSSIKITSEVNETLEDILKITNFHTLVLQDCQFTPETITEFLNILEYYKSVSHFEVAMNFEEDDTWKCFCSACSNIMVLESLSFKGMVISELYMRHLINAIKNNSNITTLKFDGCMLVKLPSFYLVESLMTNKTIRELYLPSTGLYTKEADALQRFLVNNTHLKVLDISNNNLGDRGLEVLAKGLCVQTEPGVGLSVLVIFNNQITEKSGPVIKNIITDAKNLHTLNIGYNHLTDEVLNYIAEGLPHTQSLEGLGLQCTLLTCKGMLILANAIPNNSSLQKINLKGNKAIQLLGVETLCNALTNSKITKIEIDENNRSCSDPEAYSQLVKKLNAICTVNKNYSNDSDEDDEVLNISQKISRKVSLSCEPRYGVPDPTRTFQVGSPLPSPASSPAPKSRFQIVKVPENGTMRPPSTVPAKKSRFRVTRVPTSPDDDVVLGRFANIRGSVSSNDSVDSLTTIPMETDSG